MTYRRLLRRVVVLRQEEEETSRAMREMIENTVPKLQEYQNLLKTVEDQKIAQDVLDRAIALDRETSLACRRCQERYHELGLKLIELHFTALETLLQLRTKNTFMVRVLRTQNDRELDRKSRKVVQSLQLLGGAYKLEIEANRERSRIRKLMDESWPKEWVRLTELK
jgi:hypothetical protein